MTKCFLVGLISVLFFSNVAFSSDQFLVRINGLDTFSESILPAQLRKLGLDHLAIQDQVLVQGKVPGFTYTLTLEKTVLDLQLSTDTVHSSFQIGNLVDLTLEMPEATFNTVLTVDIRPVVGTNGWIHGTLPARATGIHAQGDGKLSATAGEIQADDFQIADVQVDQVTLVSPATLSKAAPEDVTKLLNSTPLCHGECKTTEDLLTQAVNAGIKVFLQSQTFQGPIKKELLSHLKAPLKTIFQPAGMNIALDVEVGEFETLGATGNAVTSWKTVLQSTKPFDACANSVIEPLPQPETGFPWSLERTGDLEVAFPPAILEKIVYLLERQGQFCVTGGGKKIGIPYSATITPVGQISSYPTTLPPVRSQRLPTQGLALRVPFNLDIELGTPEIPLVTSKNIHGYADFIFSLNVNRTDGLFLKLENVKVPELSGSAEVIGIGIPISWFKKTVAKNLKKSAMTKISVIHLLKPTVPITESVAIELGEQVDSLPDFLWSSFKIKSQ